jgi:hypothetical protein
MPFVGLAVDVAEQFLEEFVDAALIGLLRRG